MRREKLQHLAVGAALAIVLVVPLGAYAFIKSGIYDVAAFRPHSRFTEWVTHETMIHSVRRHATTIKAPARFAPRQIVAGFCAYQAHCAACHGAADVAHEQWVNGLEPAPPYLLDEPQRFDRRELFWVVQNGIKMTGMPSWRESMSEEEIWDVVAWLEASPKLPPQTYASWARERRCASSSPPLQGRGQGVGGE